MAAQPCSPGSSSSSTLRGGTLCGGTLLLALLCGCADAEPDDEMTPPTASVCTDCASSKYPDLAAFFARSLHRTCSPNFGVCHNSRQSPDFTTLAHFVQAIGQPCNQLRDDLLEFDNLCEPAGDQLQLVGGGQNFTTAIARLTLQPPGSTAANAATFVLGLKAATLAAFPTMSTLTLTRQAGGLPTLSLPFPTAVLQMAAGKGARALVLNGNTLRGARIYTGGPTFAQFLSPEKYVPGAAAQVVLADPNRDGVFGADLGGLQIKPGDPRNSYLLLRMLAPLASPAMITNTQPPMPVLESQMPLANFDYWDIDNSTYAMYCWIKGLTRSPDGRSNALDRIDYAGCGPLPDDLKPIHQGGEAKTWSAIWSSILQPSCATAGCHDQKMQASHLDLSDPQRSHVALWNQRPTQTHDPNVKLIYPFNPDQSYLVQKLRGTAPPPNNSRMPLGRELPDADRSIAAIVTWINQGARNN